MELHISACLWWWWCKDRNYWWSVGEYQGQREQRVKTDRRGGTANNNLWPCAVPVVCWCRWCAGERHLRREEFPSLYLTVHVWFIADKNFNPAYISTTTAPNISRLCFGLSSCTQAVIQTWTLLFQACIQSWTLINLSLSCDFNTSYIQTNKETSVELTV